MTGDGGLARTGVTDDAPGIASAEAEAPFAPFHRLGGLRSKEAGGVGLGRAAAHSIVRAHAGEVT